MHLQTVWMEQVPEEYISKLDISTSMTHLTVTVHSDSDAVVHITIYDEDDLVATSTDCKPYIKCIVAVPSPRLWSPEDPHLCVSQQHLLSFHLRLD